MKVLALLFVVYLAGRNVADAKAKMFLVETKDDSQKLKSHGHFESGSDYAEDYSEAEAHSNGENSTAGVDDSNNDSEHHDKAEKIADPKPITLSSPIEDDLKHKIADPNVKVISDPIESALKHKIADPNVKVISDP